MLISQSSALGREKEMRESLSLLPSQNSYTFIMNLELMINCKIISISCLKLMLMGGEKETIVIHSPQQSTSNSV